MRQNRQAIRSARLEVMLDSVESYDALAPGEHFVCLGVPAFVELTVTAMEKYRPKAIIERQGEMVMVKRPRVRREPRSSANLVHTLIRNGQLCMN